MMQRVIYFATLFIISQTFTNCAKRGNPSGGTRDSIPPVIIKINPENYHTNFNEKEIKISTLENHYFLKPNSNINKIDILFKKIEK